MTYQWMKTVPMNDSEAMKRNFFKEVKARLSSILSTIDHIKIHDFGTIEIVRSQEFNDTDYTALMHLYDKNCPQSPIYLIEMPMKFSIVDDKFNGRRTMKMEWDGNIQMYQWGLDRTFVYQSEQNPTLDTEHEYQRQSITPVCNTYYVRKKS